MTIRTGSPRLLIGIIVLIAIHVFSAALAAASPADLPDVKVYEGSVEIPTYDADRETQPPLFGNSTVDGMYPFPTYLRPFKAGGPKPQTYRAVFLENEYLKLTYLPEFGGRFFSLYDKVAGREVFYRNDVIKPTHYNSRRNWPQFGVELTGPYDTHMLTLHGEPFWSHKVIRHEGGSASLVLGTVDPVYRMRVNFAARLYPGLSAMQLSVFCFNTTDGKKPQMLWVNTSLPATEKTRFVYPMTRTIGHTTSEIADWPLYNDIDYSWDRNNKHMLGVFGIDIYDDFQGAYHHDLDYGVFRYADRRIVQGMKMWTFGYSDSGRNLVRGYTDNAGPYVEVQSGRHVWDGHYEWVYPHKWESWSEWWFPVSGIGGLTTTRRDVALNLEVKADPAGTNSEVRVGLSANRSLPGAKITVQAKSGELLNMSADLAPGKPFNRTLVGIRADADGLSGMVVRVTNSAGEELLNYLRPDGNPGRKEYTPFTAPLEKPQKDPSQMSAEELVLAAESKFKELNAAAALDLLKQALARDEGSSRAHLLLGIHHFNGGRYGQAVDHLEKAIERDPYLDEAYHYLAVCQMEMGEAQKAERNLYYIQPWSAYFANREYHLGRLAFLRGETGPAVKHLEEAVRVNGYYLGARFLLALIHREQENRNGALEQLAAIEQADPTSRWAAAERYFLTRDEKARAELLRLMGGQSQEAIEVALPYRQSQRWNEAVEILQIVEKNNQDPWGTPPEFYYTLAYCLQRKGETQASEGALKKARASAGNVDRFPFRRESEAPLAEAVERDPKDAVARYNLACLLYHLGRPEEAIEQWEAAVDAKPDDFSSRRALGLAYAEQGHGVSKAAAQLEKAIEINPAHVRTFNDLSGVYARAGNFTGQLAQLKQALQRSPGDDNLVEGMIEANLILGRYDEADNLIRSHRFQPRHRTYGLRDKYRFLRYGMGAVAFNRGDYQEALKQFELSLKPPVSLGVDDFQFEATPRVSYYIGRTLEAMGRRGQAREAYEKGIYGFEHLSGDRDSWNSENFHMVLSLEKLGRREDAAQMLKQLENFAQSQMNNRQIRHRSEARYLLGLVKKHQGDAAEAKQLMEEALKLRPDSIGPRFELRGDVVDPLPKQHQAQTN